MSTAAALQRRIDTKTRSECTNTHYAIYSSQKQANHLRQKKLLGSIKALPKKISFGPYSPSCRTKLTANCKMPLSEKKNLKSVTNAIISRCNHHTHQFLSMHTHTLEWKLLQAETSHRHTTPLGKNCKKRSKLI